MPILLRFGENFRPPSGERVIRSFVFALTDWVVDVSVAGAAMRNEGGNSSGGGVVYSSSPSLVRRRGEASADAAAIVAPSEDGGEKDVQGVGDHEDEGSTVFGQVEEVIKRKGVELLMLSDVREFYRFFLRLEGLLRLYLLTVVSCCSELAAVSFRD